MDADVEEAALEQVAALLQRPDQLEKLPELKKRADRKKLAVEAMLRTGVQGQLEGIRTAIAHLQTASEDVTAISQGVADIRERLKPFPQLKEKLRELRDANARHGQYAAAMENLKHIFNLQATLQEIRDALDDDKSGASCKFFQRVDVVVAELSKNMWFILGRTLEMVKGNEQGGGPQQVVTCLRIVEREERIDNFYMDARSKNSSAFVPPGRPRNWKEKALRSLEKTVVNRVDGNQLEDRSLNKAWLARYLEVCRNVIMDDLQSAKVAIPCFPPDWQIYDRYVNMYHSAVCRKLREVASDRLEKSELVQLMSWIKFYASEDMLGHPKLKINAQAILQDSPVLTRSTLNSLCDQFVEMSREDLKLWLKNTVSHETLDWNKNVRPSEDNHGYFYTDLPNTVFGMLKDTRNMSRNSLETEVSEILNSNSSNLKKTKIGEVTLAKEVSVEVIPSIINLTIQEFHELAGKYRDAFTAYKTDYFAERGRFQEFTSNIIAVANNLHTCIESTEKYKQQIRLSMEGEQNSATSMPTPLSAGRRTAVSQQQLIENMDALNLKWSNAASVAINYLREEVIMDIAPSLAELFSKKWLIGSAAPETICMTISDYYHDHKHLRPVTRSALLMDLQFRIVSEYLKAIETKRLTFTSYEERATAGKQMKSDVARLDHLYAEFASSDDMADQLPLLTSIISAAGEVISLKDKSLLSLEATSFARKFPNCPAELLAAILATRDDVGRSDARSLADEVLQHVQFHPKDQIFDQLFALRQQESSEWLPSIGMANVFKSDFISRLKRDN
ncbi:Protein CBR-SEC-6 [Caenorhabditis briggsae]|uniref:Protein CBR-SEC-6 n=1 Tax=Caenorhabditis briggsae TaxID=6238 RepID=A8WUG8_CAEBR|nr:Protein CBR-SEC-6 [Caenorhabditis briggsae]CAP24130.2 Protein CBR-SEC-6 [Caenorhabditis briggsae]